MKPFHIIVAMDQNRGIGIDGKLPWNIPADLKYFKKITTASAASKQNAVVMGRKTWESIPEQYRPLPGRINLVLTRNNDFKLPDDVLKVGDFNQALEALSNRDDIDQAFIIGGQQIFETALAHPSCQILYVTHINHVFDCDTFFPEISHFFSEDSSDPEQSEGGLTFRFTRYIRSK